MDILTVTQLNNYVKSYIDANPIFSSLFVRGELSNFKLHTSGHCYMTLKDENSAVRAVMFRSAASGLKFRPESGMKVIAAARVSCYERDGIYQLYINEMQPDGAGAFQIQFERLKEKLQKEGLFDSERKKVIPKIPQSIGVVTSPTGAAIRDILSVLCRRWPGIDIFIYPAKVQGEGAAETIKAGIDFFNRSHKVDVIITGRGGGSIEDLWCFNDESVARSIAGSLIPVISAVGHETDYTIADFVADLRAPTPSAAAELAVPAAYEVAGFLQNTRQRLNSGLIGIIKNNKIKLMRYAENKFFKNPALLFENKQLAVINAQEKLLHSYQKQLSDKGAVFERLISKLDILSPLKVMKRGYVYAESEDGTMVNSVEKISVGGQLNITFSDGEATCDIKEIKKGI